MSCRPPLRLAFESSMIALTFRTSARGESTMSQIESKWAYTKGLHDLGNGCYAYLQPDGSWGWSNAGLISDSGESMLVDTLFDLRLTQERLDEVRPAAPAAAPTRPLMNPHSNRTHTLPP